MKITETHLQDCFILENDKYEDERGFFTETYNKKALEEALGKSVEFVQDNLSKSYYGVVRGLHYQKKSPQGKLVRVTKGAAFDVAVDIRKGSRTFGKWFGLELSENNNLQLWIPEGFAHGFVAMSDEVFFEYKCTNFYMPSDEGSIYWKDTTLAIDWPDIKGIKISKKDAEAEFFENSDLK